MPTILTVFYVLLCLAILVFTAKRLADFSGTRRSSLHRSRSYVNLFRQFCDLFVLHSKKGEQGAGKGDKEAQYGDERTSRTASSLFGEDGGHLQGHGRDRQKSNKVISLQLRQDVDRNLKELKEKISLINESRYLSGKVTRLNIYQTHIGYFSPIYSGWTMVAINLGPEKNFFVKKSKRGNSLPLHYHDQIELLQCMTGKVLIWQWGKNNEVVKDELKPGDSIIIPAKSRHCLLPLQDCELMVKFTPDILKIVEENDKYPSKLRRTNKL